MVGTIRTTIGTLRITTAGIDIGVGTSPSIGVSHILIITIVRLIIALRIVHRITTHRTLAVAV